MRLLLFPFKTYVILVPFVLLLLMFEYGTVHFDRLLISDYVDIMVIGYIVSNIILFIGEIFSAAWLRSWKPVLAGLIYAVVGLFMLAFFILPGLAATRQ